MAVIKFCDVSYTYQGAANSALSDISLAIEQGEYVGIWGTNGSGKSTLLSCINGLIPHFHHGRLTGEVMIKGQSVCQCSPGSLAKQIGTVLQDFENQIIGVEVEEEVSFGSDSWGGSPEESRRRVAAALAKMGLAGFERRLMQQLSGGQKQKVILAGLLAGDFDILLLDEPTSALDTMATANIYHELKENHRHRTILVASQKLSNILPWVTRLIVLDAGKILYDGDPKVFVEQRIEQNVMEGLPSICRLTSALHSRGCNSVRAFSSVGEAHNWVREAVRKGRG
jgi:energy-coupling factor transporter ATP-binding protein EcfA2